MELIKANGADILFEYESLSMTTKKKNKATKKWMKNAAIANKTLTFPVVKY
jgi:hypothetical protein